MGLSVDFSVAQKAAKNSVDLDVDAMKATFRAKMGLSPEAFLAKSDQAQQQYLATYEPPILSFNAFYEARRPIRNVAQYSGDASDLDQKGLLFPGGTYMTEVMIDGERKMSLILGNFEYIEKNEPEGVKQLAKNLFEKWYLREHVSEEDIEAALRDVHLNYDEFSIGSFERMVEKMAVDEFYALHFAAKCYLDRKEMLRTYGDVAERVESKPLVVSGPCTDMDSAPRDSVIMTDYGTAIYVDQRDWGSPVVNGWYSCDAFGNIPTCAEDGMAISAIEPSVWVKFERLKAPEKNQDFGIK